VGERALLEMLAWLHGKTEEQLAREEPEEVYLRFKVERAQREREAEARDRAVEEKLEEYWRWARARSQWLADRHFRKAGRQWLVTESAVFEEAQDALSSAVLGWAYGHTQDPDFLRKSPPEVAVYLLVATGAGTLVSLSSIMSIRYVSTHIQLPPGAPSAAVVNRLFQRVFGEYRWFVPERYGRANMNERLEPDGDEYSALVGYYEKFHDVTVAARTDRDYVMLLPARADAPPFTGSFIWTTATAEAKKARWRDAHLHQVAEVMRMLGSPMAQSGLLDELYRKKRRVIPSPDGVGSVQVHTVRDPSEGLAGLYWRNFFGPPFVRMFGDRLQSLPPGTRRELGGDIVLVQPYELPTQAMTREGDAAEQRLITVLGPECFYDHQQHRKPTRVPELSPGTL
jgi:hypothetical protein